MKDFIHDNFLLETDLAVYLYHEIAKVLPIIDYHNHLSPKDISENRKFENLTQAWLEDDHYKWRAMRAAGVDEKYITGSASDKEKFLMWAKTVPNTVRNPLFHWTHLELKRYFGINELLNEETAVKIYESTAEQLKSNEFSVHMLLKKMNVEVVCTTDDPIDSLEHHFQFSTTSKGTKLLPTFRPDRLFNFASNFEFNEYVDDLESTADVQYQDLNSLIESIQSRHDYFSKAGCRLSDHGLSQMPSEVFTFSEADKIFKRIRNGDSISNSEIDKLKSCLMHEIGRMNYSSNFVMQLHIGALRNTNSRLFQKIGKDAGADSISDISHAKSLMSFLDGLDQKGELPKTILYNLNPADNEVFATLAGNFNQGPISGKVQWGSAWWFLDQKDGIENQLNVHSNMGLISTFIGMLTDSRSFLSFPRHEYFRRIFCNLLGNDVKKGLIPNDIPLLSTLVKNVCYHNAKNYFEF